MRHLIVLPASLALLALAAAASPVAAYDTIDCGRDKSPSERTICSSQALQILDAKVTESYADIMLDGSIKGQVKRAVHASQMDFLERRDACGRNVECLAEVMERRSSRINFYR